MAESLLDLAETLAAVQTIREAAALVLREQWSPARLRTMLDDDAPGTPGQRLTAPRHSDSGRFAGVVVADRAGGDPGTRALGDPGTGGVGPTGRSAKLASPVGTGRRPAFYATVASSDTNILAAPRTSGWRLYALTRIQRGPIISG